MSEIVGCIVCGKTLTKNQEKCCSRSCSAKYGNSLRKRVGSINISSHGYRRVYLPDHPRSCSAGYVYEHRLIMEHIMGRFLNSKEIVHHKNGNKQDNSPENLELFNSQSQHCKLHNNKARSSRKFGAA